MAKRNIPKLIIQELWHSNKALKDFDFAKDITDLVGTLAIGMYLNSLINKGLVHHVSAAVKDGKLELYYKDRRTKTLHTPENTTVDEFYAIFLKKQNTERVFNRYNTYEGPRGNESDWKRAAGAVAARTVEVPALLDLLGLKKMPATKETLKKAWKRAMLSAHPDKGGSTELAQSVNAAYEKLVAKL